MANLKSSRKRILVAKRNQQHNNWYKKRMRSLLKEALQAVKDKKDDAVAKIREAISFVDKAASKKVIARNKASHKKSQLMKLIKA